MLQGVASVRSAVYAFKYVTLTALAILFLTLAGGAEAPVTGNAAADFGLWFVILAGSAAALARLGWRAGAVSVGADGAVPDRLARIEALGFDLLGIYGGVFVGLLMAYCTRIWWREQGATGITWFGGGVTVLAAGWVARSVWRFARIYGAARRRAEQV